MKDKMKKIEEEFYKLAECQPLNDEDFARLLELRKEYEKLFKRICPKKSKIEFRFTEDTSGFDISDSIEPRILMNPYHEGYIVQRVVEIIEYHDEKPDPQDIYYINKEVAFNEPKNKNSA